jgi:hypothetical protein
VAVAQPVAGLFNKQTVAYMLSVRDVRGLVAALNCKDDAEVRQAAATALGAIGDQTAWQPLMMVALTDPDPDAKRAAASAAQACAGNQGASRSALGQSGRGSQPTRRELFHEREPGKVALIGIGAVAWLIWFGLVAISFAIQSVLLACVFLIAVLILVEASVKGNGRWRGGGASQLMIFVIVFLAGSIIGLPVVFYWTGKGIAQWFGWVD